MDRFIGSIQIWKSRKAERLKSNMDRFIVFILQEGTAIRTGLKSNMDRFIAVFNATLSFLFIMFKIQYG